MLIPVQTRTCADKNSRLPVLVSIIASSHYTYVELPVVIGTAHKGHRFQSRHPLGREEWNQLRSREEMRDSDGHAEVAELAARKFSFAHINTGHAVLPQQSDTSEDPARATRPKILVRGTEHLDNASDGRKPAVSASETRAHVPGAGVPDGPVELDIDVAKLAHHTTLVLLIEKQVAEAPDGQLVTAGSLKTSMIPAGLLLGIQGTWFPAGSKRRLAPDWGHHKAAIAAYLSWTLATWVHGTMLGEPRRRTGDYGPLDADETSQTDSKIEDGREMARHPLLCRSLSSSDMVESL